MSYPAQLQHWLGKDYEVRNFGISGATLLKKGDKPYWNQKEYSEECMVTCRGIVGFSIQPPECC